MSVQEKAAEFLNELHYDNLIRVRQDLYRAIDESRREIFQENEMLRPKLQADIKRLGDALTLQRERGFGPGDVVYDELVRQIRIVNLARGQNRSRVNVLSEEQSIQKAALAEINREISAWGAEEECEDDVDRTLDIRQSKLTSEGHTLH